jgi:hypothetical protein
MAVCQEIAPRLTPSWPNYHGGECQIFMGFFISLFAQKITTFI